MQTTLGQGPCVDAVRSGTEHTLIVMDDVRDETRWLQFTPAAGAAGIASLLSAPLDPGTRTGGALNMYGTMPGVFDTEARRIATAFATQASIALAATDQAAGLRQALNSRDVIGQAKGILLERFGLTDQQQAFDLLVQSSQDTQTKLADVARWLVEDTTIDNQPGTTARPGIPPRPTG